MSQAEPRPPFILVMNALVSIIPPAPRVPGDYLMLLTYQAPQNRVQARREAATVAREMGLDTECKTNAEEL